MYEPNTPQAEAALATIAQAINRPRQRADHLRIYNKALALWRDKPLDVRTVKVYDGWDANGPAYRQLRQEDFTTAMDALPLFAGHRYRIYVRYTCNAVRRFDSFVAQDADELTAPSGNTIKIGEMRL